MCRIQIHRLEETENGMQYVIENCVLECQQGSQEGKELKEDGMEAAVSVSLSSCKD